MEDPADSMSVDQILEAARVVAATLKNRNHLLRLLRLMDADHYLSVNGWHLQIPFSADTSLVENWIADYEQSSAKKAVDQLRFTRRAVYMAFFAQPN